MIMNVKSRGTSTQKKLQLTTVPKFLEAHMWLPQNNGILLAHRKERKQSDACAELSSAVAE